MEIEIFKAIMHCLYNNRVSVYDEKNQIKLSTINYADDIHKKRFHSFASSDLETIKLSQIIITIKEKLGVDITNEHKEALSNIQELEAKKESLLLCLAKRSIHKYNEQRNELNIEVAKIEGDILELYETLGISPNIDLINYF